MNKNGSNAYYWRYNANGMTAMHTDYVSDRVYYYTYDSLGRIVAETEKTQNVNEYRFANNYTYDTSNNLTQLINTADGLAVSTKYTYDTANRPSKTYLNAAVDHVYSYDALGRLSKKTINTSATDPVVVTYTYWLSKRNEGTDQTYRTTQIGWESFNGRTYGYTYDKAGNLTEIKEKPTSTGAYTVKATYVYDELGQLTRENNLDLNKTIVYNYNSGGNLTSRVEYPYTTGTLGTATDTINYTYDSTWKDKLTKYDGDSITYDAIGNPLTYRDGMSFTWQGRQMKTANLNGTSVSYKYNADGLRTYKKVGSTVHEYEYSGDKLFYEKRGDIKFYYRYDVNGDLAAITRLKADGTKFTLYPITNSRGDVEELRKSNGDLYARYVYDSWGNTICILGADGKKIDDPVNLSVQNPFRYRGYYFDAESGLYYLQSRYYDPVTCRFLNADGYVSTGTGVIGYNMYTYCGNNPVNRVDASGLFWERVGKFFSKIWNGIMSAVQDTFGVSSSVSIKKTINEIDIIPEPAPITLSTGSYQKKTYNTISSSKPIVIHSNVTNGSSTSIGIKCNSSKSSLDLGIKDDGVGITGSYITNNMVTHSLEFSLDSSHNISIEYSCITWDGSIQNVSYIKGSVDLKFFVLREVTQSVNVPSYPSKKVYLPSRKVA